MLNPTEKKDLEDYENLVGKKLANLNHRLANKVKGALSELDEVNNVLEKIPEKTAMRRLNDKIVADMFRLTVTILRIMRFAPVGLDPNGMAYVIRFGPGKPSKDGTTEFTARMEPATKEDIARHCLVETHIKTLQRFIDLNRVTLPSSPDIPLRPLSVFGVASLTVSEGYDRYCEFRGDPMDPYNKHLGFK